METITLSDGRKIGIISFAIASSGHMYIRVNMSLGEAASFFSSGTDRIVYKSEGKCGGHHDIGLHVPRCHGSRKDISRIVSVAQGGVDARSQACRPDRTRGDTAS